MEQFKHLFTPLKIGPVTVRNRVLFAPHGIRNGENHMPGESFLRYHAERAKGGAGLLIMGCHPIHPTGETMGGPRGVRDFDDSIIPYYRRIADAVHEHGGKIFVQHFHAGLLGGSDDLMVPVWAPSAVTCGGGLHETPKEMEVEDIQEIVQAFGRAAKRAKESGLDGVELHFAATSDWLVACFLSPLTNKRTDEYGGSLENRMRFPLEIIDCARENIGYDMALGVRISGDELLPGGLTLEDMKVIAQRLEATGKLDYINVTIGTYPTLHMVIPPMAVPPGYQTYLAAGIKEVVSLPVFTIGRINDPLLAEKTLADGHADMIGMVRAHICDPELANKAREGRLDDIRTCIACNQGCIGRVYREMPVTCVQNPATGREKELGIGTLQPAATRKKVMVIGGGPAGLEAVRVAALRGHQVTLYEKESELGGQVNLAAKAPYREEFGGITRYLSGQVKKLGVEVKLGEEVTPEMVEREAPDAVVVATGSRPQRSGFTPLCPDVDKLPGVEQKSVVTYEDVLMGKVDVGEKVVVIDDNGHYEAAGTVEYLADQGKKVEVITRFLTLGTDLTHSLDLGLLLPRLAKKGVVVSPSSGVRRISEDQVTVFDVYSNEERVIDGVDTVVLAMGKSANDGLYRSLKGRVKELHRIGDCVAPRRVDKAIYEGNKVGRIL